MEPTLGWGIRMAIATVVPVVWGISTGHEQQAEWIALTADCIGWVALKGNYGQRLRVLAGGAFLAFFFCLLGSVTGNSLLLSIISMLAVGFIAGIFKNLGDRGSGLSICVFVVFLIANAHPVQGRALEERLFWITVGGAWNTLLGTVVFLFMPVQQPYRRGIALIWKAAASLAYSVSKGWDGKSIRSSARDIYLQEKEVRTSLDGSFAFYEKRADQMNKQRDDRQEYRLAQVRKAAALVATHISAIHDEAETLSIKTLDGGLRIRLYEVLRAVAQCSDRAAMYILTLRSEEGLLLTGRMDKLEAATLQLQDYIGTEFTRVNRTIRRIIQLSGRIQRLIARAVSFLEAIEEKPEYRSYSLVKTVLVLHPKHWWRNIRLLFNIDTHTFRYALRTAVASGVAIFFYMWFKIDHGYWLPFTVIIVLQPYFGATLRKAFDRVLGTLAGGIVGGLLLRLPAGLHVKEIMMFASAVLMIYFYRRKYTVSAFFITLNLVLLFAVAEELNRNILYIRALTTLGGALIAIIAGFLLLPTWDRKYLPRHIRSALRCNWEYFRQTLLRTTTGAPWTKYKRQAEAENSNAFDSFNRFMQEFNHDHKNSYRIYYGIIAHIVRITREINNLNLELDAVGSNPASGSSIERQQVLVDSCINTFKAITTVLGENNQPEISVQNTSSITFTAHSEVYLERLDTELKALQAAVKGNI